MNSEDVPLTSAFDANPLEYMQQYVRNLNNEIFLSEYHINNLYALLLIGRNSPWDDIKGNSTTLKQEVDAVVNSKVADVKTILESLSNIYEDKAKKCAINQIEKLMNILKSKRKAIFIEKDKATINFQNIKLLTEIAKMADKDKNEETAQITQETQQPQEIRQQQKKEGEQSEAKQGHVCLHNFVKETIQSEQGKGGSKQPQLPLSNPQKPKPRNNNEVFSIFYGLANLTNLSALALTNIIQYNSSQRYIKFKISENYNMKIRNQDPLYFDRHSALAALPSDLFVNHIFPYLSASELFKVRSVCKEWLQSVKQAWHATFKRQMFVQLLACEFCKDIQFFYKTIQLRNPFFQKLSLLIHALIEIIQWQNVYQSIRDNTLNLQLKRILIIILRLTGQNIPLTTLNAINDEFFNLYKDRLMNLKERAAAFFSTLAGSDMTITDLRVIKSAFLDDPFMRVEEMNAEDKSPLLLTLFAKQMTLQQILRNHIFLGQEYLLNTKRRLDDVSRKMVYQKGYLQGVYKILLLKSAVQPLSSERQQSQLPNFHEMLQSIFSNKNSDKPDFVIKNRSTSTEIFLDNATKLDLILTTVYNLEAGQGLDLQQHRQTQQVEQEPSRQPQKVQQQVGQQPRKESRHQITASIDLKIECKSQPQPQSPPQK